MTRQIFGARETALPGCIELSLPCHEDNRGRFVKILQHSSFKPLGLPTSFPEVFYSESRFGVIRGLHFQLPPAAQGKLVYCPHGQILDAVVDLRAGSPTFGQHILLDICAQNSNAIYIPAGIAHGFRTISETAIVVYQVTCEYAPELDKGIRWDSAGIDWGIANPILSERDSQFPKLADLATPFRYPGQD